MKKDKLVYNKEMVIEKISESTNIKKEYVRLMYNSFETTVGKLLASTDMFTDVNVKIFDGLVLESKFLPKGTKINNLTGKEIEVQNRAKLKANITNHYKEKISSMVRNSY